VKLFASRNTIFRMQPSTLILRTAGTNCDLETAFAFEKAGAKTESIHVNRLLENPSLLERFQILAFPGGFSYGDDIAAGKILANQLMRHLHEPLRDFVAAGKPIIGICNGFQVLVKTDLLPGPVGGVSGQTATLTNNDCHRFIDRWVHLAPRGKRCMWTCGIKAIELPIAHGEGKFVPANAAVHQGLWHNEQVALVYTAPDGSIPEGAPPHNPNGSTDDIAGVCDPTGLVFGLMPHPERHLDPTQHPDWNRRKAQGKLPAEGDGLQIFRNAVTYASEALGAGV
jgi:phosphoribosylformylglycinamidine synthase subunit PurQ / glutaminase